MALVSLSTVRNTATGERNLPAEASSSRFARSEKTNLGEAKNKKEQAKKNKNRSRKATKKATNKKKTAKRAKKTRKIKKDKKFKKKSRKIRKNKVSKGGKNRNKQSRAEDRGDCLEIAVDALYKGVAKKASNFDRQSIRIEIRTPIIASKLKKAGDYADFAAQMNTTVGKCSEGSIDPVIANGVVEVLDNCKDKITAACGAP